MDGVRPPRERLAMAGFALTSDMGHNKGRVTGLRYEAFYAHAADGHRLALTEVTLDQATPGAEAPRGPAFLLVHGMSQNRLAYTSGELPMALLRRGARVFIAELRGHGESDHPGPTRPSSWDLTTLLRFDYPAVIAEVCGRVCQDRLHIIGHSMGGILGYALLARSHRIASLTTLAAPVRLGAGKPLVRVASRVAPVLVKTIGRERFPLHRVLRAARPFASAPRVRGLAGRLVDSVRLANPQAADPHRTNEILAKAHPISKDVLLSFMHMVRTQTARIDGVDLVDAVSRSPLPVLAVVGDRDMLAGRASVAPLARGAGPRLIVSLPEASHVDITMGHHAREIVETLWGFIRPGAPERSRR